MTMLDTALTPHTPPQRASIFIGALVLSLVISSAVHSDDAAAVFKARCARCHGEGGKSDTPGSRSLKVAPLVNDARLRELTPEEIVKLVKGNVKHRGITDLSDADLEAAAPFVRELARRP